MTVPTALQFETYRFWTQSGHGNAHPLSLVPSISLSGEMPPMT